LARGLADHDLNAELHQSYADAGGARALARRADEPAAAAPSANHLFDQLAASQGTERARSARSGINVGSLGDRGESRKVRPHGASGIRGLAPNQRRLGAA